MNVPVDTEISVEFNKPMNRAITQSAISISPGVGGIKYSWLGNTLYVNHTKNFKTNRTYIVTIEAKAVDMWDNHLSEPFIWNFTTGYSMAKGPATIINITPEPNSIAEITTVIQITFSKDIISNNADLNVKTPNGSVIDGSVKYTSKDFTIKFNLPDGKYLGYNSKYTVTLEGITVNTGVFSIQTGNKTYAWEFSTKPASEADSDGDGMDDQWELDSGLNPVSGADANKDPDKDGLTNLEEYLESTDPKLQDSDNDGLNDGAEIITHFTDPLDDDSDDDGHLDGEEIDLGTDPNDGKDYPGKKVEEKESEPFNYMLLLVAIIIIIVVVLVIFMVLRGRSKGKGGKQEPTKSDRQETIYDDELDDDLDAELDKDLEDLDDQEDLNDQEDFDDTDLEKDTQRK
jgi:hypothetical protein